MTTFTHKQYLANLQHCVDDKYQWLSKGATLTNRLVTINTKDVQSTITPELTTLWATRFTAFIQACQRMTVGRTTRKLLWSPLQRQLLDELQPVIELSTTDHVHIHVLSWELDGESIFSPHCRQLTRRINRLASKHLLAVSINHGQPSQLLSLVQGVPRFTPQGQSAVIRSGRYLSGQSSHRLFPDRQPTARQQRKQRVVQQQLWKQVRHKCVLTASRMADLGNCCQRAVIDEDTQEVTVTADRSSTVYRRTEVLTALIHRLNLENRPFSFVDPEFMALFDPQGQFGRAVEQALTRRPVFDTRKWVDRGRIFGHLYDMRGSQRCLIAIRPLLELMDDRLFKGTYWSAEQQGYVAYWGVDGQSVVTQRYPTIKI